MHYQVLPHHTHGFMEEPLRKLEFLRPACISDRCTNSATVLEWKTIHVVALKIGLLYLFFRKETVAFFNPYSRYGI